MAKFYINDITVLLNDPEKFVSGKISMFVLAAQNEKLSFPSLPPPPNPTATHMLSSYPRISDCKARGRLKIGSSTVFLIQ